MSGWNSNNQLSTNARATSLHHLHLLVKCDLNHEDQALLTFGSEQDAEACTVTTNAADASEGTDNTEIRTATAKAADNTDVNEAFMKPSGNPTADSSENESLKKPLQDGRLTDQTGAPAGFPQIEDTRPYLIKK